MRVAVLASLAVVIAGLMYLTLDFDRLMMWAVDAQRGFQNQIARAVRALKAGEPNAYLALLSAAGAYGFVHAIGPGHGKYLVGGVGLGTLVSAALLMSMAVLSSLLQAAWAILLVYGGFALVEATAQQMTVLAEDVLASVSYWVITCVGLTLVWRGVRGLRREPVVAHPAAHDHHQAHHAHHAHHACGCHAHGPSAEQVAQLQSVRETIVLILSIAIRPCTGAIFLLVIAWQMDLRVAGAVAVMTMGVGTAGLTSLVAVSSIVARGLALASSDRIVDMHIARPALQVFAGTVIALCSLGLHGFTV